MTSIASADHVPSFTADAREEVGKRLQATLVELLDLALVGKQPQLWMIRSQLPHGAHA